MRVSGVWFSLGFAGCSALGIGMEVWTSALDQMLRSLKEPTARLFRHRFV